MRRFLAIGAVVAAAAGATAIGPFGGDDADVLTYKVELDNAFGLTEGADFRTTGVKVGSVSELDVDARTARAIATVEAVDADFGELRDDASCSVQPQSLIGEYYLDCAPGTPSRPPLREDATIPVERTSGTVPPDLVLDIMRRPYRERLTILLAELGAGLAARGQDLNTSIRRAVPALRETEEVLEVLGEERQTLRRLIDDANVVVGRLADGREDVGRFVSEARDAAQASAERRTALQQTVRRLPDFQRGLRPVLADLQTVAQRQTPALRDLRLAAPGLTTLLDRLGPFAEASVPALRTLGAASVKGRSAVRAAASTVDTLSRLAVAGEEPARNARITLEHLDDPKYAVEPEATTKRMLTGLEAFLKYPYVQAQAINLFDVRGYTLKLNVLVNECTQYTNAKRALDNPERTKLCSAALGDGAPPLTPEPTTAQARSAPATQRQDGSAEPAAPQQAPAQEAPAQQAPAEPQAPTSGREIRIPGLPPIKLPPILGGGKQPSQGSQPSGTGLLDFLLGS